MKIPAFLYGMGVSCRNWAFDSQLLKCTKFSIPIICVGNLQVGGTGKTPHVELLIRLLQKDYRVAVLTRGYGRKTKKPIVAGDFETPETIGDEPLQIHRKFPNVMVYVDGNRRRAIREIEAMPDSIRPDVILMDDGYQHRYVEPAYSILLTPYHRPYYEDALLPYGRLREQVKGSDRADSIIVTHTPRDLTPMDIRLFISNLDPFDYQDVYFSRLMYDLPKPLFPDLSPEPMSRSAKIVTFCGIADPSQFLQYCEDTYPNIVQSLCFLDHQEYTLETLTSILEATKGDERVFFLTTEKDETKILPLRNQIPLQVQRRMWVLPIRIDLSPESSKRLLNKVHKAIRNNGLKIV